MASSCIFDEFATKVDRVITSLVHQQVILTALRDLADGKSVRLLGTEIEPLSGIGQQAPSTTSSRYLEAMTRLLVWGMRVFPVDTTYEEMHLWVTMGMLDEPRGYNQLYVNVWPSLISG